MRVLETVPIDDQHSIEFGISTWTEHDPEPEQEESIRRRYNNPDGVFSPHGSSEVPMYHMGLMICECLKRDKIDAQEIMEIIKRCEESLKRIRG